MAIGELVNVRIGVGKGVLRLRWHYPPGTQRELGMGLTDKPANRAIAQFKADEIRQDIFTNQYDPSLAKYRGQSTPIQSTTKNKALTLPDLWAEFVEYRTPTLGTTTINGQYRHHGNLIAACPHPITQPDKIRAWVLKNYSLETARRWMVALNAAGKWGEQHGKLITNPFQNLTIPKSRQGKKPVIDPFTAEERDLIIEAFRAHPTQSHYWSLVQFLAFSGCRPGEAIALKWKNVEQNHLTFKEAVGVSEQGRMIIKEGLKTQLERRIPLSDKLREAIGERGEGLVFRGANGGMVPWSYFSRRSKGKYAGIWYEVLDIAGVPHKNPYQLRHTYITCALAAGLSLQDVGAMVGSSAESIFRHYAGVSRVLVQPDI